MSDRGVEAIYAQGFIDGRKSGRRLAAEEILEAARECDVECDVADDHEELRHLIGVRDGLLEAAGIAGQDKEGVPEHGQDS